MKKIYISLLLVAFLFGTSAVQAQKQDKGKAHKTEQCPKGKKAHRHGENKPHPDFAKEIEFFVDDLSSEQKDKLQALSKENKKNISKIRKQQHALQDSIHSVMMKEGDQSATLFPLFEKDAQLRVEIDKELYKSKLAMEVLLTPQQLIQLHEKMKILEKYKPVPKHRDSRGHAPKPRHKK